MFKPYLIAALCLAALPVHAGTLANGAWNNSRCGDKPVAPSLDLRNPDAFNKSVEVVNAYRQKVPVYLDCLVQEANADIQQITAAVSAEQQAARAANDKILADVKAANAKFGDK